LCLNWWCLGHHRQRWLQLAVSRQPRSSGRPALEQHGVALVLAKDGARRTQLEAGRRHEGTLTVEKTACATQRFGPRLNAASLGDAEGQHGDEEGGAGEAAQPQGGLVMVKPAARGGHRGVARGAQMAPGHDRRRWVAPDTNVEARRRWRNALGPALRRLGWGLVEQCWSSRTGGLGRRARDGEGGAGGVGARRSVALATNE
jgi:hypothetical protein